MKITTLHKCKLRKPKPRMKGEKLEKNQQEDNKILTVYNLIASSHGLRISLKLMNTDEIWKLSLLSNNSEDARCGAKLS